MIRALIAVASAGTALIAVVVTYYAISYAVLWLVSKAFPLVGRRRR